MLLFTELMDIFMSIKQATKNNFNVFRSQEAFTLAETLITLGIIGIVAAITIPPLQKSYQSMVLKSAFKKTYSTLNNALLKVKSNYGVPKCYYGINGASTTWTECSLFLTQLRSELKTFKYCSSNAYSNGCIPMYNGGDSLPEETQEQKDSFNTVCSGFSQSHILNTNPAFILSDGSIILAYSATGGSLFAADINGFKPPNKWGIDVFSFYLISDGDMIKLFPATGVSGGCMQVEDDGVATIKMAINNT